MNVKVVQVGRVVGSGQAVSDGPVVVGVLVGSGNAQDVGPDVRVLLHVLNVFLKIIMFEIRSTFVLKVKQQLCDTNTYT